MVGIYGIEQEIENQIVERVNEIGFNFIQARPISDLEADHYLQVVRGSRKTDGTYATWIHNSSTGGLQLGHYDLSYEDSYNDFHTR